MNPIEAEMLSHVMCLCFCVTMTNYSCISISPLFKFVHSGIVMTTISKAFKMVNFEEKTTDYYWLIFIEMKTGCKTQCTVIISLPVSSLWYSTHLLDESCRQHDNCLFNII